MVEYEPGRWFKILFRINGTVLPRIILRVLTVARNVCDILQLDTCFIPEPQDGKRGVYR